MISWCPSGVSLISQYGLCDHLQEPWSGPFSNGLVERKTSFLPRSQHQEQGRQWSVCMNVLKWAFWTRNHWNWMQWRISNGRLQSQSCVFTTGSHRRGTFLPKSVWWNSLNELKFARRTCSMWQVGGVDMFILLWWFLSCASYHLVDCPRGPHCELKCPQRRNQEDCGAVLFWQCRGDLCTFNFVIVLLFLGFVADYDSWVVSHKITYKWCFRIWLVELMLPDPKFELWIRVKRVFHLSRPIPRWWQAWCSFRFGVNQSSLDLGFCCVLWNLLPKRAISWRASPLVTGDGWPGYHWSGNCRFHVMFSG